LKKEEHVKKYGQYMAKAVAGVLKHRFIYTIDGTPLAVMTIKDNSRYDWAWSDPRAGYTTIDIDD
jgi:hypothetical protein